MSFLDSKVCIAQVSESCNGFTQTDISITLPKETIFSISLTIDLFSRKQRRIGDKAG